MGNKFKVCKQIKERPFLVWLQRSPYEWKTSPAQNKSSEKEMVPDVGD
jgi:hypothetical protein